MKVVLQGSPLDPMSLVYAEITSREMMLGQAFVPLQPQDLDTVMSRDDEKYDFPLSRWYIRSGEMPDGTPLFVYARLAPPRISV